MEQAIIFFTFDRSPHPQYICETLALLPKSDPRFCEFDIHIIIDGNDTSFVTVPEGMSVQFHPAKIDATIHRRIANSYLRAFDIASTYPNDCLICEDDIKFRQEWVSKLSQVRNEMSLRGHEASLLTLYQAHHWEMALGDFILTTGKYFRTHKAENFFGGQAVIFPKSRLEAAKAFWSTKQFGSDETLEPNDICIGRFARSLGNDELFTCTPTLVQHCGQCSHTGLSAGWFHQSHTFGYKWPE